MQHRALLISFAAGLGLMAWITRVRGPRLPHISAAELERDVRVFLAANGPLNAVEWVQILTGVGRTEAQAYVAALEAQPQAATSNKTKKGFRQFLPRNR